MAAAAEAAKPNSDSGEQKPAEPKPAAEQKPAEPKPAEKVDDKSGEKPAENPAGKDDQAKPESKAPEKYTLTIPQGARLTSDDLTTIEAEARAADLSQEDAQAYVADVAAKVEAQSTAFRQVTEADPVYGGAHLDETTKHATRALDKLRPAGTPRGDALRALLHRSGYGNHLEVVSLLADLGKLMAEDGTAGGSGGGGSPSKDPATVLYGSGS